MEPSKKLLLIDGHSILNRTFYGLPDLTSSEGLHTGAVYGFINILLRLIENEQPDYVTVAFDVHAPTFRHKIYKEYKGTRKPMPQELRQQVPLMKEVLDAMKVSRLEEEGLEADDILGTLAKRGESEGMEVCLVSGDRDLLQIASDHIVITIPKTKGGRTEIERYYAADVKKAYEVTPQQFIELKALMGDTADNIPGVPKVGEKTARSLMVEYGSIENIYQNLDHISKKSVRESLAANRDLCDLSKVLATINTKADLNYSFDLAALPKDLFNKDAYTLFKRLGFKNLLTRFANEGLEAEDVAPVEILADQEEVDAFFAQVLKKASSKETIGFSLLTEGTRHSQLLGAAFYVPAKGKSGRCIFVRMKGDISPAYMTSQLQALSEKVRLASVGLKESYAFFTPYEIRHLDEKSSEAAAKTGNGADVQLGKEEGEAVICENPWTHTFDALIAAYLLNPLKSDYQAEDIASEYLSKAVRGYKEIFGKGSMQEAETSLLAEYAGSIAQTAALTCGILSERLEESGMLRLFQEIEMPLSYVLYDMERIGMLVKKEELQAYGESLTGRIQELEDQIHQEADSDFNINSPKQLGEVLFDQMHLPGAKKTKTGYSTAADVLDKLAPDYPIVQHILEYRGLAKLKSTYADGLADYIDPEDSRIHTVFHQTIRATGRISSSDPNLQNIPMRTDQGRAIRKVFVPRDDYVFTDADYSQIELRILAHMSGDEGLIEAFKEGKDIHRSTASKVFHTPFDQVTDLQRRNAKAVNFGIVYGISAFGLAKDLNIGRKEAADYINGYFETYPGIKAFLDKCVADAKEKGYAETLYGRRRPMPELKSGNFMQRQFGERVAMNAPIQGTAADIMKIAMNRVWRRLRREKRASRLILQIHDELLIETAPGEEEAAANILKEEMENAAKLSVTLTAECGSGSDWFSCK